MQHKSYLARGYFTRYVLCLAISPKSLLYHRPPSSSGNYREMNLWGVQIGRGCVFLSFQLNRAIKMGFWLFEMAKLKKMKKWTKISLSLKLLQFEDFVQATNITNVNIARASYISIKPIYNIAFSVSVSSVFCVIPCLLLFFFYMSYLVNFLCFCYYFMFLYCHHFKFEFDMSFYRV